MNLLSEYQIKILDYLKFLSNKNIIKIPENLKNLTLELPPRGQDADISCNAALILSKFNEKNPIEIADILKKNFLKKFVEFKDITVAKPGFLNISFNDSFWSSYLIKIVKFDKKYGSTKQNKKKFNVEFVSANPTGPLHVGHCRGAVIGDVISRLLKFNGHKVVKEFYVNDYGNQIRNFVLSVYYRILEIVEKKKFPNDLNLYPGEYIIDIAKKVIKEKKIKNFGSIDKIYNSLLNESIKYSMFLIKSNLSDLDIKHDNFVYESQLIKKKLVTKTIENLKKNKYVYLGKLSAPKGELPKNWKEREQLLFASSEFGDDVDRPLQKEDKTWTYFAGDIAYHADKVNRNFDTLINILGSDHSGYIKRITAAVKAVSKNKTELVCKVSQLVKLYRDGNPFKMSKRKGDYITVKDLIKEVGKDSVRFMMLNRSNDVELDFDFQKVTDKSKENPVFYVQYAYARINSVFKLANINIDKFNKFKKGDLPLNVHEINMLKKISVWPRCVQQSMDKLEPHRIPFYLYELATLFHAYWNLGIQNNEFRFILNNKVVSNSRLLILKSIATVIKNGMNILGVSTPKSM